jgi:hypothetical protein
MTTRSSAKSDFLGRRVYVYLLTSRFSLEQHQRKGVLAFRAWLAKLAPKVDTFLDRPRFSHVRVERSNLKQLIFAFRNQRKFVPALPLTAILGP